MEVLKLCHIAKTGFLYWLIQHMKDNGPVFLLESSGVLKEQEVRDVMKQHNWKFQNFWPSFHICLNSGCTHDHNVAYTREQTHELCLIYSEKQGTPEETKPHRESGYRVAVSAAPLPPPL